MSRPLLSSNVVFEREDHEEWIELNDWKLGSTPRGTMIGWGYRESRFLPKPPSPIRRAITATVNAALATLFSR
jgi:hypothetical protein